MREAPDKPSYQNRLAIWLTHLGEFAARQIADWLSVSKQAIWLWISQYNRQGPEGLERQGRGGRRWADLSVEEEAAFLPQVERRALAGEVLTAKQLHAQLVKTAGREVSLGYVYRLLHRHGWRKLGPRPRHPQARRRDQEGFRENSPKVLAAILRRLPAGRRLRLLFQVEHIWNHLRENHFGNRVLNCLERVVEQLCLGLRQLHRQPHLVQSMTCFDCIKALPVTLNQYWTSG